MAKEIRADIKSIMFPFLKIGSKYRVELQKSLVRVFDDVSEFILIEYIDTEAIKC